MLLSFDCAVSALADCIIRERCSAPGSDSVESRVSVTQFLMRLHASMPDYLRLPMRCLTLAFDAWPLLITGKPFHRLSHERRCRQIEAWRHSRFGKFRDLIKFYDSLVIFGWYSALYPLTPDAPGRSAVMSPARQGRLSVHE